MTRIYITREELDYLDELDAFQTPVKPDHIVDQVDASSGAYNEIAAWLEDQHIDFTEPRDPAIEKPRAKQEKADRPRTPAQTRNATLPKRIDAYPELRDFYNDYDEATILPSDKKKYEELLKTLAKDKIRPEVLKTKRNFYLIEFSNVGGLVMPIILKIDYTDGSAEELRIPAEIWRVDNAKAAKLIMTQKEIKALQIDPHEEIGDADVENNFWPRRAIKSRFQLFKEPIDTSPMKELKDEAEKNEKTVEKKSAAKAEEKKPEETK
jgi:hypothetical protein